MIYTYFSDAGQTIDAPYPGECKEKRPNNLCVSIDSTSGNVKLAQHRPLEYENVLKKCMGIFSHTIYGFPCMRTRDTLHSPPSF
jgi:hypothetical protein